MQGAARAGFLCWLICAGAIVSCGKDSGAPAAPHPKPNGDPITLETPSQAGSEETGEDEPARLELEAEFHRTRFGLGTGIWVLGVVHNPHAARVTDVRPRVRLLDEAGAEVGQAEGRLGRALDPGERAAVAVAVPEPVAHEELSLEASATLDEGPSPEPLALKLAHEPPQRADLGGWYVLGTIENPGSTTVEGARLEVQGFDAKGQLLGLDWLELEPLPAGETVEFELGDLRYEERPSGFLLLLRGPTAD
ncbi:MAG: FxLYD domain-containing protein [Enhygromyxa sp.]